jgi:hypothetical protein
MSAIVFTDIRAQKLTQNEAIEASAQIAESLYTKVYNDLNPYHPIKKP